MNNDTKQAGSLFAGFALILLGSLFLLDRLDIIHFGHVVRYFWPLIIVGIGVWRLLNRDVWGGLWMLIIGIWLQVAHSRLFGLGYSSSWPLLLIGIGLYTILRALFGERKNAEGGHGA